MQTVWSPECIHFLPSKRGWEGQQLDKKENTRQKDGLKKKKPIMFLRKGISGVRRIDRILIGFKAVKTSRNDLQIGKYKAYIIDIANGFRNRGKNVEEKRTQDSL